MAQQQYTTPLVCVSGRSGSALEPIRGHERSAILLQKVRVAKAQRLTCCELGLVGLTSCVCWPFCCCGAGWHTVGANTVAAFFRFGKLVWTQDKAGVMFITPGVTRIDGFAGTQSLILPPQNIIDASGNPIIVRALLEYSVDDPAALYIATNNQPQVRRACVLASGGGRTGWWLVLRHHHPIPEQRRRVWEGGDDAGALHPTPSRDRFCLIWRSRWYARRAQACRCRGTQRGATCARKATA